MSILPSEFDKGGYEVITDTIIGTTNSSGNVQIIGPSVAQHYKLVAAYVDNEYSDSAYFSYIYYHKNGSVYLRVVDGSNVSQPNVEVKIIRYYIAT